MITDSKRNSALGFRALDLTYRVSSDTSYEENEGYSERSEWGLGPPTDRSQHQQVKAAVQDSVVQENTRHQSPVLTEVARLKSRMFVFPTRRANTLKTIHLKKWEKQNRWTRINPAEQIINVHWCFSTTTRSNELFASMEEIDIREAQVPGCTPFHERQEKTWLKWDSTCIPEVVGLSPTWVRFFPVSRKRACNLALQLA